MYNMQKEEQILIRHLIDLSRKTYYQHIRTYSEFVNLGEIHLFLSNIKDFEIVNYKIDGGYPEAERCCISFYDERSADGDSPVICLSIQPVNQRFSDRLTHRDVLGAILHLGIERNQTGDIIIDDNIAYLFCTAGISEFITNNLIKVKHTKVNVCIYNAEKIRPSIKYKIRQGTVSSIRLDAVISLAFSLPRSKAVSYILAGSVYVNGLLVESSSYMLKDNDVISVRKLGKFKFENTGTKSRKDNFVIKTHIYI